MNELAALLYGVIQGLTEFLPVSSSGHLALIPHFLSFKDPGVIFDLAMHVGTAFSIILYFHKDLLELGKMLVDLLKRPTSFRKESAPVINMIFATAVTVFVVLLIKDFAVTFGRNPLMIAGNLAGFGLFMFAADTLMADKETGKMEELRLGVAFWVGLFQAIAIFPGVSRSGSTLTVSRLLGLGREEASRFSFLLSLPIIFAGFLYKIPELLRETQPFDYLSFGLGILVSFLTGLITIHYFLKFIKKLGLGVFSLYRIVLAFVVYWVLIRG